MPGWSVWMGLCSQLREADGVQGRAGSSRADLGGRAPPAPGGRQEGGCSLEAWAPRVQKVMGMPSGLEVPGGAHQRAWLRGPKALPCQASWLLWGQPTSGACAGGIPPSLGLQTRPRQSSFSSPETRHQPGSAGPGALGLGDRLSPRQASSMGRGPPMQLPQERPRQGKKDGRGSAGGRQFTGGGHRSPGPGAGPERPPREEPAPSLQWEDGETWTWSFSSQVPRGIAALGCQPEAPRDTTWPEVAPGGSVRPPLPLASSVSRCLARALCSAGAQWDLFVAAGRPGRTRRLQGPSVWQGLRLVSPAPCCCVTGCPPLAAAAGGRGGAVGRELRGSLSAPQHLLDR